MKNKVGLFFLGSSTPFSQMSKNKNSIFSKKSPPLVNLTKVWVSQKFAHYYPDYEKEMNSNTGDNLSINPNTGDDVFIHFLKNKNSRQ